MSECPKCGGSMRGPIYCTGQNFKCHHDWSLSQGYMDHLVWTCTTCGYERATETKQALPAEPRA